MAEPLEVVSVGMVNGVGLSAAASAAAMHCALDAFHKTSFVDKGGKWIIGSETPLDPPCRGVAKLARMAVLAIEDCLEGQKLKLDQIPVLLCLAEKDRPSRLERLDELLLGQIQDQLRVRFHQRSGVFSEGHISGVIAIDHARKLIGSEGIRHCLVVGVDSFLVGPMLADYEKRFRVRTSENSDGFIPGDGAGAVLLSRRSAAETNLAVYGTGYGVEKATVESADPHRADGLVQAIRGALTATGCAMGDTDYRITDVAGEQYYFRESTLAVSRILRELKDEYDILHPADCIGDVGAAVVPTCLAVTYFANLKGYAPGAAAVAHFGNDDGRRGALILRGKLNAEWWRVA